MGLKQIGIVKRAHKINNVSVKLIAKCKHFCLKKMHLGKLLTTNYSVCARIFFDSKEIFGKKNLPYKAMFSKNFF